MDEGHANQAVCAPPPQLISTRRKRLCLPQLDETSAPPATPVFIQRVRGSTTMLKNFSDTVKFYHARESLSSAPLESAGDLESMGEEADD